MEMPPKGGGLLNSLKNFLNNVKEIPKKIYTAFFTTAKMTYGIHDGAVLLLIFNFILVRKQFQAIFNAFDIHLNILGDFLKYNCPLHI